VKDWKTTRTCLIVVAAMVALTVVGNRLGSHGTDRQGPGDALVGTCFASVPASEHDVVDLAHCDQRHRAQKIAELDVPAGSPDAAGVAAKCPEALTVAAQQMLRDGVVRVFDYRPAAGSAHLVCMLTGTDKHMEFVSSAI
jgi:hypothetical protein